MNLSELFKHYIFKFCFRFVVFLITFLTFIIKPELLDFTKNFTISVFLLFLILLIEMFLQLNPLNKNVSHGCLKQFGTHYVPPEEGYDEQELRDAICFYNKGAIKVAIAWILPHIVIGYLYYKRIVGVPFLVMLTSFFYLSDLICVIFFCPFQKFLMHNRCCVNCRIFAWGMPMMILPLVFINNMLSRVICVVAFAIAIRWEIVIKKYPERFWVGSNMMLRCVNCKDKMCQVKKPLSVS